MWEMNRSKYIFHLCVRGPATMHGLGSSLSFPRWSIDWAVQHYRNTWISGGRNVYNWSLPLWLPAVAFCSTTQRTTGRSRQTHWNTIAIQTKRGCPNLSSSLSQFAVVLRLSPSALPLHWKCAFRVHTLCTLCYKHTYRRDMCCALAPAYKHAPGCFWFLPKMSSDEFLCNCLVFLFPNPLSQIAWWLFAAESGEDRNHQQRNISLFSCEPLLSTYCTLEGSLKGWP